MTNAHLPLIKICGLTSVGDAEMAVRAGATALGVVLSTSSRQVSVERASLIMESVGRDISRFGVFRTLEAEYAELVLRQVPLDYLQIHGPLEPDVVELARAASVGLVKALAIDSDEFYDFDDSNVDLILVDGANPGSGIEHSWESLQRRAFRRPVVAAGGLRPDNVAMVIESTKVEGVDVSSGVESGPGVKDEQLVRQFVANARRGFEKARDNR